MRTLRTLVACGLLAVPTLAQAQVDIEYREADLADEKFAYDAFFEVAWHEYDNLDFRKLDESSDQAILDSDDRGSFAFTGLSGAFGYKLDDHARFVVGASHRGLWGNDQTGNINVFGGWMYFTAAYVELTTAGEQPWRFRVGRQFYRIGGLPGEEYVFLDIIDGVRVDAPLGDIGFVTLIPIEVPSFSGTSDGANFVDFIGQSNVQTFNFRGDTISRRHGAVLALDGLADGLDLRAYSFYTDIGALGTGSDITYNGELGNFSDNDWVANFGVRGSFDLGSVTPWASLDASTGIDRKEAVASDVNANGLAWYVGVDLEGGDDDAGLRARASYFDAFGPSYRSNGLQYSHGYVGLKAQQVGGTISDRFLGWHPTAYVGMFGVTDTPHEMDRKSGTRVLHGRVGYDFGPTEIAASYWFMQDTGVTSLDFSRLDNIDPPFGYSREEFRAERRMGEVLGQELNLDVYSDLTEHVTLHVNGAVLLPGGFYAIEVARVAGDALGGWDVDGDGEPDPQAAWGANASMRVRF